MNWWDKREPKLDAGAKAEIKELYDGTPGLVSYLAKIYKVSRQYMMYVTDHQGKREKAIRSNKRYVNKHRERVNAISRGAVKRYKERKRRGLDRDNM